VTAEALIAEIVADPAQELAWLAYADWLLERDDVRGELIQLAINGGDEALRRIRLLEMDEEPLLSAQLLAQRTHWHFTWNRGFVRTASSDRSVPFSSNQSRRRALTRPPAHRIERGDSAHRATRSRSSPPLILARR